MITDPTRMCELLVGLPTVRVLGVVDEYDGPLFVHIETTGDPAARANAILAAAAVLFLAGPLRAPTTRHSRRERVVPVLKRCAAVGGFVVLTFASQAVWVDVIVQPAVTYPEQPTFQYDLAALSVRTGRVLLPESSLRPGTTLADLEGHFTVHGGGVNDLLFTPGAPVLFMLSDQAIERDIRDAWLSAIRSHPMAYLRHRVSFTRALLGLSAPYARGSLFNPGSDRRIGV